MKIIKCSKSNVSPDYGTTFYKTNLDQIESVINSNENELELFNQLYFKVYGYDCIDFKHNLFGSFIFDDKDLYICDTDGDEIEFQGDLIDPEQISDYITDPNQIKQYVKSPDDDYLKRLFLDDDMYTVPPELPQDVIYYGIDHGYNYDEIVDSYNNLISYDDFELYKSIEDYKLNTK